MIQNSHFGCIQMSLCYYFFSLQTIFIMLALLSCVQSVRSLGFCMPRTNWKTERLQSPGWGHLIAKQQRVRLEMGSKKWPLQWWKMTEEKTPFQRILDQVMYSWEEKVILTVIYFWKMIPLHWSLTFWADVARRKRKTVVQEDFSRKNKKTKK